MSSGPKPNCPWRKPPKHPLDHAEKIAHVIGGMMFGAFAAGGFVIESFFGAAIFERSMWIPAAILLVALLAGGLLGAFVGRPFIDWIEEHWSLFWRRDGGSY